MLPAADPFPAARRLSGTEGNNQSQGMEQDIEKELTEEEEEESVAETKSTATQHTTDTVVQFYNRIKQCFVEDYMGVENTPRRVSADQALDAMFSVHVPERAPILAKVLKLRTPLSEVAGFRKPSEEDLKTTRRAPSAQRGKKFRKPTEENFQRMVSQQERQTPHTRQSEPPAYFHQDEIKKITKENKKQESTRIRQKEDLVECTPTGKRASELKRMSYSRPHESHYPECPPGETLEGRMKQLRMSKQEEVLQPERQQSRKLCFDQSVNPYDF